MLVKRSQATNSYALPTTFFAAEFQFTELWFLAAGAPVIYHQDSIIQHVRGAALRLLLLNSVRTTNQE
jgi:hypothetical protein